MSNLERDLRNLLSQRADAATTSPGDWQDLTVRMARRNKRSKRLLASGLVVALLVGPLAGFAVARAVEDSEPGGRVTAAGPGDAGANSNISAAGGLWNAQAGAVGTQVLMSGTKLDKLFRRTTSDGVAIRAYISKGNGNACQGDGWCPPADCFPDASIVGELSTDAAVGTGGGSHYAGEAPPLRLTGGGVFGASGEGSPVRFVFAQSGDGVDAVRVSFDGGGNDEMAPVDGVVLLAAPADPEKTGGTVEALDGDGNVIGHADAQDVAGGASVFITGPSQVTLQHEPAFSSTASAATGPGESTTATTMPAGEVTAIANEEKPPATPVDPGSEPNGMPARCVAPPPALPAPGEQPADSGAAKAEIEQAFATAYNGGLGSDDEKRAVVQDSESLKPVMEQIRNGAFAQQVKDATAHVTEVVFTSPTEAAVRYDINIANYTDFTGRIGKALLIDGHWKVARVTVCADISLAGGNCPTP
jgi:hypothetical protein